MKKDDKIIGILMFSYKSAYLSFMAVDPNYRKLGIASSLIEEMLTLFPEGERITLSTFRENDPLGRAARALYKKFGFQEEALTIEFNYPHQRFVLNRHKEDT